MYKESIIMLITWPALIMVCWLAVRIALLVYERNHKDADFKKPEEVKSQ